MSNAESLLGRVAGLERRLAQLEANSRTKAADVEGSKEIGKRVDKIELTLKQVVNDAIRYRGYWREGTTAIRGDAFTHNGSMWRATNATTDEPSKDSADWQVIVRKGRDGRDAT